MPVGRLYVFFGEMSIWVFCSFFDWDVWLFVVELYAHASLALKHVSGCLNSHFVQGFMFSNLTQRILDMAIWACVCWQILCTHLWVLCVVSHHQETRTCSRVITSNVCKCILTIFIFTCILAVDDLEEEERGKYLDGRMWQRATVSRLPMA